MVRQRLLAGDAALDVPLSKPIGTTTYCYSAEEVAAIVRHCRADARLSWLADVVEALAHTGLRIGELAGLRWSNLDLKKGLILLRDTTRLSRRSQRDQARGTKSHRDRVLP